MKNIKISTEEWKRLKVLSMNKGVPITKVVKELLDDKERIDKTIQQN